MKTMDESWGRFLPRALVLGVILAASVFVAIRAASAREGEPGGHTRTFLTVAGSLTVAPGVRPRMTFQFYRGADAMSAPSVCGPIAVPETGVGYDEATHTFSAQVPVESCASMFDGQNVWVTATVINGADGGVLLTTPRSAINPVPYARYADQYGTPDCPVGYERAMDTSFTGNMRLCQKSRMEGTTRVVYDEVVRVGTGASAFWVDRFEATIWSGETGGPSSTEPLGLRDASSYGAAGFPGNGQWRTTTRNTPPVHAESRAWPSGPSAYVTWFQANEACAASGKRLPTGDEWLRAAQGTFDPATPIGGAVATEARCNTGGVATHGLVGRGLPADSNACVSGWGAIDMIGDLAEWTAEWYVGLGGGQLMNGPSTVWPGTPYNADTTLNVASSARATDTEGSRNLIPAAATRGGHATDGTGAGIFSINLEHGPSSYSPMIGFRCVIPR